MAKPFSECTDVERSCKPLKSTETICGISFEPWSKTQKAKQYHMERHSNNYHFPDHVRLEMADDILRWLFEGELPDD